MPDESDVGNPGGGAVEDLPSYGIRDRRDIHVNNSKVPLDENTINHAIEVLWSSCNTFAAMVTIDEAKILLLLFLFSSLLLQTAAFSHDLFWKLFVYI